MQISSWKHLLILSTTLLSSAKGWKRFRTNTVTGDFLVCVMPVWFWPQASCSSGTKHTHCWSSAVLHFPIEIWDNLLLELKTWSLIFLIFVFVSYIFTWFEQLFPSESLLIIEVSTALVYLRSQSRFTALRKVTDSEDLKLFWVACLNASYN